ncbi:putative homolog of lactam utilization protein B [gamma proteobacterium HdN1]|nr:putative homolog of lactam utilization protein B [gamma proteobacterium HdN1]
MQTLELNADVGEGGRYDERLMPLIQRANIACGGHAGDNASITNSLRLTARYGVAAGAHPSYPDRDGFGRIETHATPDQIEAACLQQLRHFKALADFESVPVVHVKPHGALYHRLMKDGAAANAFMRAVTITYGRIMIIGQPNTALEDSAALLGCPYSREMFADRRYEADGTLTPRTHADALITDINESIFQVRTLNSTGYVYARTGEKIALQADTVCVHGDHDVALSLVEHLRNLVCKS